MEREGGGGLGMGNTCKPMAVSFQCMTKPTTKKERKKEKFSEFKRSHTDCAALCAELLRLCPTLCNPMNHILPDSSSRGILQARILE